MSHQSIDPVRIGDKVRYVTTAGIPQPAIVSGIHPGPLPMIGSDTYTPAFPVLDLFHVSMAGGGVVWYVGILHESDAKAVGADLPWYDFRGTHGT